ncbi:MAG: sigma-54-dependent Fis family transcriptional regulator [Desulfobacteraceae bacterium]|nr:sigma-54-dependent Fis family transcriptional regulator [Desulfobacteraceae bacterium]
MENILIVDDEKHYPIIIGEILQEEGYRSFTASSGMEALDILNTQLIDLVLTDVKMPGMTGIDLLEKIKEIKPDMPVIIMTAFGSVEKAVEAMHKGAYTFILKPFENEALIAHIAKAISVYKIVEENNILRDAMRTRYQFDNIIGKSKPMQELYEIIQKVAPTNASILIEGESGTGKELVARAIHDNSYRKNGPMVVINCGAIPGELLESELFGHEKGAFTGAHRARRGKFEIADQGTMFLDEIGDMSPKLQVKLLRAIQERKVERVGGENPIDVDIRIISATNIDLNLAIEEKKFRQDLFYRLNVIPFEIPPLRERSVDIPALTDHFQQKFTKRNKHYKIKTISDKAMKIMMEYSWPGNIRELENLMERIAVLIDDDVIELVALPDYFRTSADSVATPTVSSIFENNIGFNKAVDQFQKSLICHALDQTNWVKAKAAKLLQMNRTTLVEKIKKMQIEQGESSPFF